MASSSGIGCAGASAPSGFSGIGRAGTFTNDVDTGGAPVVDMAHGDVD